MMVNDPLMMLLSASDPMAALNMMVQNNPQYRSILPFIQGKTPNQLRMTAENVAREKGIDLNQLMNQIARMIPRR